MSARLECTNLTGGWGSLTAFRNLNLVVDAGAVHAVLGPNGAGKTTLMLTLAGLLPAQSGTITLDGKALRTGQPTAISRAGIALVPDSRELFTRLTVEENLRVAAGRHGAEPRSVLELFPALEPRWRLAAGALSGGEQQMLAIARGLMAKPRLLLLDEPTLGLAPIIVEEIELAISSLAAKGMAILVAEQNAGMAMRVAHRVYALKSGRISLEGAPAELAKSAEIQRLYLGM